MSQSQMITALCTVSESVVVAGLADSQLMFLLFPAPQLLASFETTTYGTPSNPVKPLQSYARRKCAHHPVAALDSLQDHDTVKVVAAAGNAVSVWDVLRGQRLASYSSADHFYACAYLGPHVVGAAGSGKVLHLFDTRLRPGSRLLWSVELAADNLYAIAKVKKSAHAWLFEKVFLAGADSAVYAVDLRAGVRDVFDIPQHMCSSGPDATNVAKDAIGPNAILDIAYDAGLLFAVREHGDVCGFSVEQKSVMGRHDLGPFELSCRISDKITTRVRCSTDFKDDCVCIAVGGEKNTITVLNYDADARTLRPPRKFATNFRQVPVVSWGATGLFFGAGDDVGLIPRYRTQLA